MLTVPDTLTSTEMIYPQVHFEKLMFNVYFLHSFWYLSWNFENTFLQKISKSFFLLPANLCLCNNNSFNKYALKIDSGHAQKYQTRL